MLRPSSVSVGISALRATCQISTRSSPSPLARAGGHEVRAEHLEHADPQAAHQQRHDRERRGQSRQDQRAQMPSPRSAAAHAEPAQAQREDLDQDDAEPERRHAEAEDRERPHGVVGGAVLACGRQGGERNGDQDANSVATPTSAACLADAIADQRDDGDVVVDGGARVAVASATRNEQRWRSSSSRPSDGAAPRPPRAGVQAEDLARRVTGNELQQ